MFCISAQGQTDMNGHTPVSHSCASEPSMGTAGMQQESGMGREGCTGRSNPSVSLMAAAPSCSVAMERGKHQSTTHPP